MADNKHEKAAKLIREIFEKEFGKFSVEDFEEVAEMLGFKLLNIKPDFDKFYKNLSDDERKTVDFMMKL